MPSKFANGFAYGCLALALTVVAPLSARAAEEATITAFSTWQGGGELFETGPQQATFVGALGGTVYVETDKGPVASGRLTCPATVQIDLVDRAQTGTGHCTIVGEGGDRIYGDIACTGVFLVGCHGDFTLTGGTGRFEGITGGGPVIIRSDFGQLKAGADGKAPQETSGIIYWRELKYKIP